MSGLLASACDPQGSDQAHDRPAQGPIAIRADHTFDRHGRTRSDLIRPPRGGSRWLGGSR